MSGFNSLLANANREIQIPVSRLAYWPFRFAGIGSDKVGRNNGIEMSWVAQTLTGTDRKIAISGIRNDYTG